MKKPKNLFSIQLTVLYITFNIPHIIHVVENIINCQWFLNHIEKRHPVLDFMYIVTITIKAKITTLKMSK